MLLVGHLIIHLSLIIHAFGANMFVSMYSWDHALELAHWECGIVAGPFVSARAQFDDIKDAADGLCC